MQDYFKDKRKSPWHRVYSDIEKYWPSKDANTLNSALLLIRAGVFAALDMLSLAIAVDASTNEILKAFVKESDWQAGRKAARSHCSRLVEDMIERGDLRHLVPAALKRDGFGYLLRSLEKARWDEFVSAKPKVKRKKLDLKGLEDSIIGRDFLKEQMITETRIPEDDDRVESLIEAYDHYVIEYEVSRRSTLSDSSETEQTTLNGSPLEETVRQKQKKTDPVEEGGETDQAELTEFVSKKPASKRRKKKGRKSK